MAVQNPGLGNFPLRNIFPSGRQALSQALTEAGLDRGDRVAIPEWSSQCVINAVGAYAMPIPINEVIAGEIKCAGVLVYEQWGWPLSAGVLGELEARFTGAVFIKDMVDSAHYFADKLNAAKNFKTIIRVLSLSKLLGVTGGGLATVNDRPLAFEPEEGSVKLMAALVKQGLVGEDPYGQINTILKSQVKALDPHLTKWLSENDVTAAVKIELAARQRNLAALLKSPLSSEWPVWMKRAVEAGAGPGIAPLLRGAPEPVIKGKQAVLLSEHGVETSLYHFNWSGDPLNPAYEKCLAFPVHGLVEDIAKKLEFIKP
ncbi:MAG: hypothetical protein WC903_06630 [Candidatus Margulisiibacteriota bacterium]